MVIAVDVKSALIAGIDSHNNSQCRPDKGRDSSLSNLNYQVNFYPKKNTDVSRCFSLEENSYQKIVREKSPENKFLMSYNGAIDHIDIQMEKENFRSNTATEPSHNRDQATESILMKKVSRILEKRDLSK